MPAPEIIHQLVAQFTHNREAYRSGKYNEAQLRQEFLNPFFEALGWDMVNRSGYAPQNREVIHEDSIDVEGGSRAPDYCFRLGQTRKFFVEAKKPAVDIQYDIHPAYQLRRYAWNVQLPLSILTDFEEFAVYDCRNKPGPTESAATARVMFIKYTQYVEKWDVIAAIFSREAVWKGSFDQYAADKASKKGTTQVDDAFLQDIEGWRLSLARNIALRNPQVINERQLNYAVQMTIDRLIFLRICEDRGIEPENQLREICKAPGIYASLVNLFQRADLKYNSGLFHFKAEKDETSAADSFTPALSIDDQVLKEIVKSTYYPCPYIFKEIPVEILGQVYEQFLGKVIRLTAGHQAKVEEKPEVRKAGGVYYTPRYIVDYIVANTLGKLLEGKTPESASQLKIVDPACGSGSFLLGAFQHLLDWHLAYYTAHEPEKWAKGKKPALTPAEGGGWKLTSAEKKRILVNNLHGVDIDAQAVEVTKLSLLLKVLEEESGQLSLGLERVLPDLGRNIQCGNSLIGWDYFEGQLVPDEKDVERVNPFDWQRAFAPVFARGGFDAVIGNPPYIRIQAMKEWAPQQVEFYKHRYQAAGKGNYDIYVVFVEKGLGLLNPAGRLGFILPHKFFNSQYGEPLRGLISAGRHLAKVVHFGDQQVFENATTYTCLMFLSKQSKQMCEIEKVTDLRSWRDGKNGEIGIIEATKATEGEWNFIIGRGSLLFEKLTLMPTKLGDIAKIFVGLQTSADVVFLFKDYSEQQDSYEAFSVSLSKKINIEKDMLKRVVRSGDIGRYWAQPKALVLFPYRSNGNKSLLIPEDKLIANYPHCWNYLLANKKLLSERENGKFKKIGWYQLYPKNLDMWEQPKIMMPYMITRLSAYYDEDNLYFVNVTTGGFGLTINSSYGSQKYYVGLLNSLLLDWFIKNVSTTFHGGYFAANKQFLVQIPIRTIDFNNPDEVKKHNQMVTLVERMLELHRRSPLTPQEQERLAQQMAATDAQIDRLVYDLYGLTEDEIRVVEGT